MGVALLAGCAQATDPDSRESTSAVLTCAVPSEQIGTFLGRWQNTPIPIAISTTGGFTAGDVDAIKKAADTWNRFFQLAHSKLIINYGDPANPTASGDTGTGSICSSGGNTVVIHRRTTWSNSADAIAVTTVCPPKAPAGSPVNTIYAARMEINFKDFYVTARKPDLQTIVTHELGHMLGLDHSCENTGSSGMPSCKSSALPPAYSKAIMFPSFTFTAGIGEVKRNLNENDQGRANCLYP